MKNSLKLVLCVLTLGVLATAPVVHAQDPKAPPAEGGRRGGRGGRGQVTPEARVAQIEQAVGTLTADQKSKITAILTKQQKDTAALGQDATREQRTEITQAANKEIRAVLTADQQTKFDAMPAGGRGGRGGAGGGRKKGN